MFFRYGIEKFCKACTVAEVDGLIVPDLLFEESRELAEDIIKLPIDLIMLATPSSKVRLKTVLENAEGFVYCVLTLGVTGRRIICIVKSKVTFSLLFLSLKQRVFLLKAYGSLF